jgi:hypothetical protein
MRSHAVCTFARVSVCPIITNFEPIWRFIRKCLCTLHLLGPPQHLTFGFTVVSNKDSVRKNLWAVRSAGGDLK